MNDLDLKLTIEALVKGVKNVQDLNQAVKQTAETGGKQIPDPTTKMRAGATATAAAFRDLRRTVLLAFVGSEVIQFTSGLVEANKQAQKIDFTLQAVTGSAAGARAEFEFVSKVSRQLGLDLASTAAGYSRLAASAKEAGLPTETLHKGFVGLSEALTVLHAPADEVNRILVQLDQALSLGKVQMQDLRAISNSLPGVFGLVNEAFAGTGKSVQQMLNEGGIPAQEFFERFTALLHEKYGPAAVKAADGLNASLNKLHTTIFGLETEPSGFVESFTHAIQDLTRDLNDPALQSGLASLISGLGRIVELAVEGASKIGQLGAGIGILAAKIGGIPDPSDQLASTAKQLSDVSSELKELEAGLPALQNRLANARFPGQRTALQTEIAAVQARISQLKTSKSLLEKAQADLQKNGGTFGFTPAKTTTPPVTVTPPAVKSAVTQSSAQIDAMLKLLKDALDRQMKDLDYALAQHLISFKSYYDQRSQISEKEIDAEIAAERKKLTTVKGDADKQAAILANITILERKRGDVAVQAARDQHDAEKKVADQLQDVRNQLLQVTGHGAQADIDALHQKFAALLATLKANGDTAGVATLDKYFGFKEASINLSALQKQFQDTINRMQAAEQSINVEQQAGLLTQLQAQQQLNDLHAKTATQVAGLIPQMQTLAAKTGDPDAITRVAQMVNQFHQLQIAANSLATQIAGTTADAFSQLFSDIGSGVTSAKDAFMDFLRNITSGINQIVGKELATEIVGGFGNKGSGGSGLLGFVQSVLPFLAPGKAGGGPIRGPGTGTSDSVPLWGSSGEFMVRTAAVNHYGESFMHAINNMMLPRRGFAVGGLIGGGAAAVSAPASQSMRIVNVIDPALVNNYLTSSAGEKTIVNVISRNAGAVKQVLR